MTGKVTASLRADAAAPQQITPFEKAEIESSMAARFARVVALEPQRLALQDGDVALTYAELGQLTNRLANAILALRGDREEGVAILLQHGYQQVVALWGILKAGKACVPLGAALPVSRNAMVLADSQAGLILTNDRSYAQAQALAQGACQVLNLDALPAAPSTDPGLSIAPERLAALLYTSGSTGESKGVQQTQRNYLQFGWSFGQSFLFHIVDRVAHIGPITAPASINTLLVAMLKGTSVWPFDLTSGLGAFNQWLRANEISVCFTVPSLFRSWVTMLEGPGMFPALRVLMIGGETLYSRDVDLLRTYLPGCKLANTYGAAEALMIATWHIDTTRTYAGRVPVGYPELGKAVLLLDAEGRPVPQGEAGEIVVQSRYVSPGYWRRPELTAAVFTRDPLHGPESRYHTGDLGIMSTDGCLEFLGRKDAMIKVHGQRVEPGEVESRLLGLGMVEEAVVAARQDPHGNTYLVAWVTPALQRTITPAELRARLGAVLPSYMVPSRFVVLPAMPVNPGGKVDRQALPDPSWRGAALPADVQEPRDELERRLVDAIEDVLEVRPVGIRDSLLELGADSLTLLSLTAALESSLKREVPMAMLLAHPCVADLAAALRGAAVASPTRARGERRARRSPRAAARHALRELRYELAVRGPVLGRLALPYRAGSALLGRICAQRWLYGRVLRGRRRLVESCLPWLGRADEQTEHLAVQRSCVSNLWRKWRAAALAGMSAEEFAQWVKLEGLANMRDGRGVVLATGHLALAHIASLALSRVLPRECVVVGNRARAGLLLPRRERRLFDSGDPTQDPGEFARQLYEAHQALQRGGSVLIAADGYMGSSSDIVLPFLGHERPFKTGFAELALRAHADVIPMTASLGAGGEVCIHLGQPLTPRGADHREQVESLVRQYVASLENHWREDPGSVAWGHLARFLELPLLEEGAGYASA